MLQIECIIVEDGSSQEFVDKLSKVIDSYKSIADKWWKDLLSLYLSYKGSFKLETDIRHLGRFQRLSRFKRVISLDTKNTSIGDLVVILAHELIHFSQDLNPPKHPKNFLIGYAKEVEAFSAHTMFRKMVGDRLDCKEVDSTTAKYNTISEAVIEGYGIGEKGRDLLDGY